MAATSTSQRAPDIQVDDDLPDEQIEELLARATARLQAKSKAVVKVNEEQSYTFPKLDTGKLEEPYVFSKGDVATVDAPRLLEQRHRKQANGIRRVEEPVAAKKLAIEVGP